MARSQVRASPRYGLSFSHWYNEVIVNAQAVARDPPAAIEGFFLMGNGAQPVGKLLTASNRLVRAAHAAFLRKFGLDETTGPPLLLPTLFARHYCHCPRRRSPPVRRSP